MPLSYKDHLRLGKKVSGDDHKLDSVDLLRICRPVNISFSTVALESVTPFLKGSNSVLKSAMALESVTPFLKGSNSVLKSAMALNSVSIF